LSVAISDGKIVGRVGLEDVKAKGTVRL